MSVFKREDSPYFWYEFWRGGLRFRGSTGETSRVEAKRFEKRKRIETATAKGKRTAVTLTAIFERYYQEHAQHLPSADTLQFQMAALLAKMGTTTELHAVVDSDIAGYVTKRRTQVSASTVNREVSVFRAIWRRSKKVWGIELNDEPNWGAHHLKEPQERRRYLTAGEKKALLEKLRPDYRALVTFCLVTGARLSSAIGLKWEDVDFIRREINLAKVKGGGSQILPMTESLATLLNAERGNHPEFVFTYEVKKKRGPRNKGLRKPFTKTGWRKGWRQALKAAKISDFRFHDLRHTAATDMLRATKNIATVQKVLGHTSIATTQRYAHVLIDDQRAALEAISLDSESIPTTEIPSVAVVEFGNAKNKKANSA